MMAINGQISPYPRFGEVSISAWKEAGLLKGSTIKPILATIEKAIVIRTLGRLNPADIIALKDALPVILG